jgi:peptidyl-prolyl cis-trans isomerase SurA
MGFVISSPVKAQEVIDRVVAIVNDDLITLSELKEASLSLDPTSDQPIDERTILNQMVESKLFEQEAKKRGLTVSEDELDASIAEVRNRYGLSEEQMEEVLKKQNLTPESFREQWRVQLLGNKLLDSQLRNKIVITDEEIEQYYKENYGSIDFSAPAAVNSDEKVEIAHILISSDTPNAEDKAREVAELAKSGKDFSELAREYSDDTSSSSNGGSLGTFSKGDLIEPLESTVESTPEGGVSGPVQSPSGYHVIKVLNRTKPSNSSASNESSGDNLNISESEREEIRKIIHRQKAQTQLKSWSDEIREKAYVEIKL